MPAPLQQVLNAQNQVRDLLSHGNASYQQIERVATPHGIAGTGVRLRWSYDPAGYFIRYLTHGYQTTTIQIYMPQTFSVQHDGQGRVTSMTDGVSGRLDVSYSGAKPSLMFHRPVGFEYVRDRAFPIPLASETVLRNAADVAAALQTGSSSLRAYDKFTVVAFAQDLKAVTVCKAHGGCASGDPPFDPTSKSGFSADGGHQPSGQSGKPAPDDKKKECDAVRRAIERSKHFRDEYTDPDLVAKAKKNKWTGGQFEDEVAKKDAADASSSGGSAGAVSASTDFSDCHINYPDEAALKKAGYPQVVIDTVYHHEESHRLDCEKVNPKHDPKVPFDTWQWRQMTETKAYNRDIDEMNQWVSANC